MSERGEPTREELEERAMAEEADRQNRAIIALGHEAQKFLNSAVAKFIRDAAESKVESAVTKLASVDPTDTAQIIQLQESIKLFRHYERCLSELVAAGDTAYQLYIEEHQTE